jgi:hypothetical protein
LSTSTVTIEIINGPTINNIPWTNGMNAQQAMESAFNDQNPAGEFTYSLQYFGSTLEYLVTMINETYESFNSSNSQNPAPPFYYWAFLVNNAQQDHGIDNVVLNPGDVVTFELQPYNAITHASSTVEIKHKLRIREKK